MNITVNRLPTELAEVRVFGEPVEITITEVESLFQGENSAIEVFGKGVTAGQIVIDERIARFRLPSTPATRGGRDSIGGPNGHRG